MFQCDTRKVKLEAANRESFVEPVLGEDSHPAIDASAPKKPPRIPVIRTPAPMLKINPVEKRFKNDIGSIELSKDDLDRGIVFVQKKQLEHLKKCAETADSDYPAIPRFKAEAQYTYA